MSFTSPSRWSDVYLAAAARSVSNCGDFLAATVLVLELQQRGAGSLAVAAVLIAAALPIVVLAPLAGRLADRVDSRLLLVTSGLAQLLVCLLLAVTTSTAGMIALVAVLSCGLAVTQPTLSALTPAMVRPADLPRANALLQTAGSLGMLGAPALGGLLMGQFGLRLPLFLDAASYLAIVAAGLAIRTRRGRIGARYASAGDASAGQASDGQASAGGASPDGSPAPAGSQISTAAPGIADGGASTMGVAGGSTTTAASWRLRHDPLLGPMVLLVGAVIAVVSAVNVIDVFFVRQTLHTSASGYGVISTVWLAIMPTGAWLLTRRRLADSGLTVAMIGMLASTCLVVLLASSVPAFGWLIPLWAVGGLTNGGENVAAAVLLGRRVPAACRGRAFATFGAVANGANSAGFLLAGVLLGALPVRPTLAGVGLVGLLVTAGFAVPMLRAAARDRAVPRAPEPAPVS
jgi:MFS family permease